MSSNIYRRPLSRAEKRWDGIAIWNGPYSEHYLGRPLEPYMTQQEKSISPLKTNYGNCECIAGACDTSKCDEKNGYVGICDGQYGSYCTCVNLTTGDYGCQNTSKSYCPG